MIIAEIVGQAPGPRGLKGRPLEGGASRKFAGLAGVSEDEFWRLFRTRNVLPRFPGKNGKGDAFPIDEARRRAASMRFRAGRVILLGQGVARAFGVRAPPLTWRRVGRREFAVVPHPSGVNRWWNDPKNVRRAKRFLRILAGGAAFDARGARG